VEKFVFDGGVFVFGKMGKNDKYIRYPNLRSQSPIPNQIPQFPKGKNDKKYKKYQ
jgi:hypothetical protein